MELPHLTQVVLLDRGQASPVQLALSAIRRELEERDLDQQRWTLTEAMSLKHLSGLIARLLKLVERDAKPVARPLKRQSRKPARPRSPKPNQFKVKYYEMAVICFYYTRLLETQPDEVEQLVLASALARFHQASLNLEQVIDLSNPDEQPQPTGAGHRQIFPVA